MIEENANVQQALSDENILQSQTGRQQIQKEYGFPQDIEWALAENKIYVLQSRPITSLYPLPKESLIRSSFGSRSARCKGCWAR